MLLSSELLSNVISLRQCGHCFWKPLRILCARSRNIIEHLLHFILTLSSIIGAPEFWIGGLLQPVVDAGELARAH